MLAVGGAHTRARRHVSPDAMPAHHPLDPLAADTVARGTQLGVDARPPISPPVLGPGARHDPAGYRSAVRDWRSRAGSLAVIAGRNSPRAIRRKVGGQAATAIGGCGSLVGRNFCPKPVPSVPL